jgi:protein-S-isoprenylcysteine O-methyltransferase Ste14
MFGFISWLIISQIFFPMSKDILKAIWIQTLCCVVTSNVLGLCLWVYIHSSQWITTPIQKDKKLATTLLLTDVENLSQDSVQGQPTTEQCLPSSSLQEKINNQNDSHVVSHFFVTCFTQFKYYSTSLQQTFNISLTLLITFLVCFEFYWKRISFLVYVFIMICCLKK